MTCRRRGPGTRAGLAAAATGLALLAACGSDGGAGVIPRTDPATTQPTSPAPAATTAPPPPTTSPTTAPVGDLEGPLAVARAATARYALDLDAAVADGYQVITPSMPDMGVHYLNPAITDFDVAQPPILVYQRVADRWQLGALEWVWPERPASPPLPGATYGSFDAACHYVDGTFEPAASEDACAATSPGTGAKLTFWHPDLVTMHVWLWYPNPDGVFSPTNPFVHSLTGGVEGQSDHPHTDRAVLWSGLCQPRQPC